MKKKIGYILVLPLLSVFLITEVSNLNGKDGALLSSPSNPFDYPYIMDESDTISIVPNSETQDSVKIKMIVHDNKAQDFYNSTGVISLMWDEGGDGSLDTFSSADPLLEEGDISNNEYVFSASTSMFEENTTYQLMSILNPGFKYEKTGTFLLATLYVDGEAPVNEHDVTMQSVTDVSFTTASDTMNNYPEIYKSGINGEDSIYNINYSNNGLTFQINGENLENTPDGNLNIVLKDSEDTYSTHTATAIDPSTNTYSITGLSDSSYEVVSIINDGITIDDNGLNDTYTPSSTINFVSDLGVDESDLTVFLASSYIVDSGLTVTDSATLSSIQFTLNVVDSGAGDFVNNLIANDNMLNITLSINGESTASYEATWQGDSANDIYTFEIDNLDPGTDYEIVSLDNTGLTIGDSSLSADNQILVVDELHSDGNFTTNSGQTDIVDGNSFNLLWLVIPIILLIIIAVGAGTYFFKNKKRRNVIKLF